MKTYIIIGCKQIFVDLLVTTKENPDDFESFDDFLYEVADSEEDYHSFDHIEDIQELI